MSNIFFTSFIMKSFLKKCFQILKYVIKVLHEKLQYLRMGNEASSIRVDFKSLDESTIQTLRQSIKNGPLKE